MSILFALRSRTIRNIKANFPKMFSSLLCPLCKALEDTQEHLLLCSVLQNSLPLNNHVEYENMRGTANQQTDFLRVYDKARLFSLALAYSNFFTRDGL